MYNIMHILLKYSFASSLNNSALAASSVCGIAEISAPPFSLILGYIASWERAAESFNNEPSSGKLTRKSLTQRV